MGKTCKAITKAGKHCKRTARESGYCFVHEPKTSHTVSHSGKLPEGFNTDSETRRFSERKGFKPFPKALQRNEISEDLKNSLWNVFADSCLAPNTQSYESYKQIPIERFLRDLWTDLLKNPVDSLPCVLYSPTSNLSSDIRIVRKIYFEKFKWYELYDFVEYTLNYFECSILVYRVNLVLSHELSAFRFVGGVITDVTKEEEIEILKQEIFDDRFSGVSQHLESALKLMSDRRNPDHRNSIKESISAVEAIARIIAKDEKATLGQALSILEKSGGLHKALKEAFQKMYGYTSDEGGIRHSMLSEPSLTSDDAKFFLLSCTSFIHYLKAKLL
jgi:hypothetical protein